MRNNRMIAGIQTRPVLGGLDRMILSSQYGGQLATRDRRVKPRQGPLELDADDDQA